MFSTIEPSSNWYASIYTSPKRTKDLNYEPLNIEFDIHNS